MNILVVDDCETNRRLLRAQLEAEGSTVSEAADGAEALAVLEQQRIDGIISPKRCGEFLSRSSPPRKLAREPGLLPHRRRASLDDDS